MPGERSVAVLSRAVMDRKRGQGHVTTLRLRTEARAATVVHRRLRRVMTQRVQV